MKEMKMWTDTKKVYDLGNGYQLKPADFADFGIHYAIYGNRDEEFQYSFTRRSQDTCYDENCFFITKEQQIIGGVVIEPNYSSHFFMESLYEGEKFRVLEALDHALIAWSDKSKNICIYTVLNRDLELYSKFGYRKQFARRAMIRPTAKFEDWDFGEEYEIKIPELEDASEIGKVLYQSYLGGIQYEEFCNNTVEDEIENTTIFLERYLNTKSQEASAMVYHKMSKKLIAVCLAGKNKEDAYDFSKINHVAVLPEYRGKGIALRLVKRALTILSEMSPATMLDVSVGNPAEAMYYKLGFFPGEQTYCLYKKLNSDWNKSIRATGGGMRVERSQYEIE